MSSPPAEGFPLLLDARFDAGVLAGAAVVAAVEDQALVQNDRLDQAVLADAATAILSPPLPRRRQLLRGPTTAVSLSPQFGGVILGPRS